MTTLIKNQKLVFGPKFYTEKGCDYRITAKVRHDDECGNGHNSFSITATIDEKNGHGRWIDCAGGCLHDDVAKHFPHLAPFIKWHLCSTNGPMHYAANVVFLAGERDHWGLLKGEESKNPRQIKHYVTFGDSPIVHEVGHRLKTFIDETVANDGEFIIDKVEHDNKPGEHVFGPKYQFAGMGCQWHECPFDTDDEACQWLEAITTTKMNWSSRTNVFGEGKPRELDAARHAAVWPGATDNDLTAPGLAERLAARLPALLEDFRRDVESLGLTF